MWGRVVGVGGSGGRGGGGRHSVIFALEAGNVAGNEL